MRRRFEEQTCPANPHPQGGRGLRRRCAFTLVELLVVMGVIAVLATLTLVSVRAITDNARLSSATNTVMASLDNARALAMKKNTIVLVVFRARFEGNNKQVVEVVTAKWTGESYLNLGPAVVDRFVPIPDVPVRSIPAGIKVAAPRYGPSADEDNLWITQSHLPTIDPQPGVGEAPGKIIGIMYGPDGTTITRNSQSDSNTSFVDFNNDGELLFSDDINDQASENDEPFVAMAPFLAVFDDDEAREMFDSTAWEDIDIRRADLTEYITQFADRIHFNRYTGVAMK
ncbi:MAG: prepilin-type N-terminal cleavage/methylation domain-containing protein [Planctomycetes bacterium]|nr:prepilin-type N-terminal cleavage/methylation domain-containing protein [Planctomycetota bacterium]